MRRLAVLAALLLASCQFGTRHSKYPQARSGLGAQVRLLDDRRTTLRGELLEVADSQLLLQRLDTRRLVVAPYARIRQMILERLGAEYTYWRGMREVQRWRARARLAARYPQGLTAEQRQQLLAIANQVAPDTLR